VVLHPNGGAGAMSGWCGKCILLHVFLQLWCHGNSSPWAAIARIGIKCGSEPTDNASAVYCEMQR
jgi:hypothetical protein